MGPTATATDPRVARAERRANVIIAVVLVALVAVVWIIASSGRSSTSEPAQRSTFVDAFGRQCTQVVARSGVALDCDAKTVESRVGGLLNDLGGHQ